VTNSREAGVILHISSLPGRYGIGELGKSARWFVDQLSDMQIAVWQFLPLGPTAFGDSPYQSLSTFAGNELLIDIGDLVDLGLLYEEEVADLAGLPDHCVDFSALIPIKNRLLTIAASRFRNTVNESVLEEYASFLRQHDAAWLRDYALYRVLKSKHGARSWVEWPAQFKNRDETALLAIEESESTQIEAVKITQFLFFRQWAALRDYANNKGVRLFGDLPIYIAMDSADAWGKRELLKMDDHGNPDGVAGVPPDYFSEDGQLWGNPLYDWAAHAADNYAWWIDRLRATAELVDLVRIDHFRGFESYWAVPADADTARSGSWEQGPGNAILDAFKKEFGELPIIAEDLGIITPAVEALRDDYNLPGMRVLQFTVGDGDFELSHVSENSVCYTATHDNDTTVGWFHGSPDDIRSAQEIEHCQKAALRLTNGQAETIHTDLIKAALSTRAGIAIAPMQDFLGLGSDARMNKPGIAGGNWRWRVLESQLSTNFCDNVASLVIESGRGKTSNECN
jgi:4-alpha-glucanotransferase